MTIKPVESWALVCDRCQTHFSNGNDFSIFGEIPYMLDDAYESEWWTGAGERHSQEGPHYCLQCHFKRIDDDDDVVTLEVVPVPAPHPFVRRHSYASSPFPSETCQNAYCWLRFDHEVHR